MVMEFLNHLKFAIRASRITKTGCVFSSEIVPSLATLLGTLSGFRHLDMVNITC